jgi:hypothetical protein
MQQPAQATPAAPPGFHATDPAVIQLMQMMQQQNIQSKAQLQAFMQPTHRQFNLMLNRQGPVRKKDPPMYEGKMNEDVELWIFSSEDYYSYKRHLMTEDSSEFVEEIARNLGKSVQNWYGTIFTADCAAAGVNKTWILFKEKLRQRIKPNDFEYNLRERMIELKQTTSIHEYVAKF